MGPPQPVGFDIVLPGPAHQFWVGQDHNAGKLGRYPKVYTITMKGYFTPVTLYQGPDVFHIRVPGPGIESITDQMSLHTCT